MTDQIIKNFEERLKVLEGAVFGNSTKKTYTKKINNDINFCLNPRTYVSRYASDKSGPKKFVLVIALLSQGKKDEGISMADIKKIWSKMSTKKLLGKYNDFYANEAKTKGWVDTKEYGLYHLTDEWNQVLN